jgi:predicted AlkP superfamily phosphohydrolase/phosphomutase
MDFLMAKNQVFVLGIDGGTWNIIKPWIDGGELPTLRSLIENGVSGNLESSIPPVTFPAWKCYSTGKRPENLGVYYWVSVDLRNRKIRPNSSASFKSKEFWDFLGEQGLRVGIIDMPTTYPPKKVNGFMISGHPPSESCEYTYPKSLKKSLKNRYNYQSFLEYLSLEVDAEKAASEIQELVETRFKIAEDVLRECDVDFLHLTIIFTDLLQHFFWNNEETKRVWKLIDRKLKTLIALFSDRTYIFIISDHGFTRIKTRFNVATWLTNNGFLVIKKTTLSQVLWRLGLNREKLYSIAMKVGVIPLIRNMPGLILRRIGRSIPTKFGASELEGIENKIDWKKSKAIPLSSLIYVNTRNSADYKKIIDFLVEKLENVKYPETGEKVIKKVCRKEEVYDGVFLSNAPDLVLIPNVGYKISEEVGRDELFTSKKSKWIADHTPEGILIVNGPGIRRGEVIRNAKIIDVAPTILYIITQSVFGDVDGEVLWRLFEDSEVCKRLVINKQTLDEKKRIRMKIAKLNSLKEI